MKVGRRTVELIFLLETVLLGVGAVVLCYQPGYFDLVRFLIGTALLGTSVHNIFLYTKYLGTEMSRCEYFYVGNKIEEE